MDRKRKNRIFLGGVKLLSGIGFLILLLIIAYLAYRGLWMERRVESDVLQEKGIREEEYVVSSSMTDNLSFFVLRKMSEERLVTWKSVTEENAMLLLYVDPSVRSAFAVSLGLEEGDIKSVADVEEANIVVSKETQRGMKRVIIKRKVLAVHDNVTGVGKLEEEQYQALMDGRISSWKELGGPDIPAIQCGTAGYSCHPVRDGRRAFHHSWRLCGRRCAGCGWKEIPLRFLPSGRMEPHLEETEGTSV